MMATATATAARQVAEQTSSKENNLDKVIQETDQRKSVIGEAATILMVRPDQVYRLLRNVWTTSKGSDPLTEQEMFTGISMIARYQLDPIAREIYVSRAKDGRLMTVVGLDGWVKILDRTDHYDGFEREICMGPKGEAEWIETRIFSKKRSKPSVYRAYMQEYKALAGFMAGKIPTHMLGIFSFRHASRLFVPLGANVVTDEEAAWMAAGDFHEQSGGKSQIEQLADQLEEKVTRKEEPKEQKKEPETKQPETKQTNGGKRETPSTHMVGDPPTPEKERQILFDRYLSELHDTKTAVMARAVYDKWWGPDGPSIEWTPDDNAAAAQDRDKHIASLKEQPTEDKSDKTPRSKQKSQLFENKSQSAQEAGH